MSIQGIRPDLVILDETAAEDDDSDHFTCCHNEDIALCGTDLRGVEWIDEGEPIDCAICVRLEEANYAASVDLCDADRCPLCPLNVLDLGGTR